MPGCAMEKPGRCAGIRDRLLAVSVRELKHAVETELLPKIGQGVTVSFAGKELLEKKSHLASMNKALPVFPI